MPIFYYPEIKKSSRKIEISGVEYNHIKNSFRKKENENISITNGAGLLAEGYIEKITPDKIIVSIENIIEKKKSTPHIALAFSLLKKNNKLIIEKCTELGCYEFFPFISKRTIKRTYSSNLINRFQKVAISALKQCDSTHLPKINPIIEFHKLLPMLQGKYIPILAWKEENKNLLHQVLGNNSNDVCLIVGPEGGFEKEEIELAKKYSTKIVNLGNHILRGETAAITIIANTIFFQLQKNKSFY
jgi:16S rRNA (uracil1498-N3)-methyltransferase